MFKNIIDQLKSVSLSKGYWLMYIVGSISLLVAALYFQFVREELPCLLCIQVRMLISLLLIVSLAGLFTRYHKVMNMLANLSVLVIGASLTERSYQLLGTERGFVFGDCGFDLGLPDWFAIEEWLPWLYQVETPCGYTPEILFGITMAEALMVMSVLLLLLAVCVFFAGLVRMKR